MKNSQDILTGNRSGRPLCLPDYKLTTQCRATTEGCPYEFIFSFPSLSLGTRKFINLMGEVRKLRPEKRRIKVKIKKIDHIGVAVKSIDEAKKIYEGFLGLKVTELETVAEQKVTTAFLPAGESEIELLESTSPDGAVAKFIDSKGEGMQHIAFAVEDIEGALKELKDKGVRLIDEKPRKGAGGKKIAFIHPKETGGVLIELCEG